MRAFNTKSNSLMTRKSCDSIDLKSKLAFEKDIEIYRAELHRKCEKNDKLLLEVVELRTLALTQDKDLKFLTNSFDIIHRERDSLLLEQIKSRNIIASLQSKLSHFEDITEKSLRLKDSQVALSFANREISRLSIELVAKNELIKKIDHDRDLLNRTLETMHIHEYDKGLHGISNGRSLMRQLYCDIGQMQSDIHNLTLSLSDCKQSKDTLQSELESKIVEVTSIRVELTSEKEMNRELELKCKLDLDEKDLLGQKLAKSSNSCTDLDSKLIEANKQIEALHATSRGLTESLQFEKAESETLRESLQSLEISAAQRIEKHNFIELTLASDNENLRAEIKALQNQLHSSGDLLKEIHFLRDKLQGLELRNEHISMLSVLNDKQNHRISNLESEVEALTRKTRGLSRERDDAIASLEHVMQSTRELTERLISENSERTALEAQVSKLKRNVKDLNQLLSSSVESVSQEQAKIKSLEGMLVDSSGAGQYTYHIRDVRASLINNSTQTLLTMSPSRKKD